MSQLIGVVGKSGTGKTTSIRNLDPKETVIFNVSEKPLPLKSAKKLYNKENKNYITTDNHEVITAGLKKISESRPEVNVVIIDDAQYIMSFEFMRRSNEGGYDKFSDIGRHMNDIIQTAKSLRDDLTVVFMFHPEEKDGALKMKTIGNMMDNYITLEGLFTVVLYTNVQFDKKEGVATYQFVTNHSKEAPAKSPMGMFDSLYVDNDLVKVIEATKEYYN